MDLNIRLDPGHTTLYNRGVNPAYYEGDRMYLLSLYEMEELLKYKDVNVSISRTLTGNPNLYTRCKAAAKYDLLLSNHSNANAKPEKNAVHIYEELSRAKDPLSYKLGKTIADTMGTSYALLTRADSDGDNYYGILRYGAQFGIKIPLIIEHGYHTNPTQCNWLLSDSNLKRMAVNVVRCIAEHYNLQLKTDTSIVYYRKGQYDNDGVSKLQTDLKRLGYPIDTDGDFGTETEAQVKAFQIAYGLKDDGLAGPKTLGKIAELIAILDNQPVLTKAPEGQIYIVQAGAYSVKEYADIQRAKLGNAGIDAIVKLISR
jgi:N-acetylmuramoyl-L-alanine amidase